MLTNQFHIMESVSNTINIRVKIFRANFQLHAMLQHAGPRPEPSPSSLLLPRWTSESLLVHDMHMLQPLGRPVHTTLFPLGSLNTRVITCCHHLPVTRTL